MKICNVCQIARPLEEFGWVRPNGPNPSQREVCKPCCRDYGRKNYRENKERYFAQAKKRDADLDALINSFKAQPCMDCGVQYPPYVMDFDHRDQVTKEFNISYMRRRRMAFRKIISEIEKCDVVCSNCHRERTNGPKGQTPARYL